MVDYTITFAHSACKELETLDSSMVNRVFLKIERLAAEPRTRGCRKLHGEENLWRIRVGDYRVIDAIYDKEHIYRYHNHTASEGSLPAGIGVSHIFCFHFLIQIS